MEYLLWIIFAVIGSIAIYWIMDWEGHFKDDDSE